MKLSALLVTVAISAQIRPFVEYSKPAHLPGWIATQIVIDAMGNTIAAVQTLGVLGAFGKSFIHVLDSSGSVRCTHDFNGSRYIEIFALHADSRGFVYAGGRMSRSDSLWSGFLVRFQPCGAVQFTTDVGQYATVTAIGTSSAGDIYVAGTDTSGRLPTTPGAFQRSIDQPYTLVPSPYGFVARLSPDGQRFIYSTYLSGTQRNCSGGSSCLSVGPSTSPRALTIAPNGDAVLVGSTNTTDFPVTQNALQKECGCLRYVGRAFVTRIDARGERLVYSTYLGGTPPQPEPFAPAGIDSPIAVSLTLSGSIVVVGATSKPDFPVTPDAAQPDYRANPDPPGQESEGFITRIGADGRLEYSSYFGGQRAEISAASIQPNGEIWLSGGFAGSDFPTTPSTYTRGSDFLTRLAPDGRTVLFSTRLPQGSSYFAALTVISSDTVLIGSSSGTITRLRLRDSTNPALLGVANAAMGSVGHCVSPGEIVSVHGIDIGTPQPAGYRLDGAGRIGGDLDGVRLYFNGMAAPLLYAQPDQINAVTPFALPESGNISLALVKNGTEIRDVLNLCSAPSKIGLFRAGDSIYLAALAALNQDGTLNSETNPAARGSIVTIYLSGAGLFTTPPVDGEIMPLIAQPNALKHSLSADSDHEILYAGPAPGQVAGLIQINVRLSNSGSIRIFNGSSQDSGLVHVR